MKLSQWVDGQDKTRSAIAAELGISGPHLTRLCEHPQVYDASPDLARRIVAYTRGAVTLEDLYGSPSEAVSGPESAEFTPTRAEAAERFE